MNPYEYNFRQKPSNALDTEAQEAAGILLGELRIESGQKLRSARMKKLLETAKGSNAILEGCEQDDERGISMDFRLVVDFPGKVLRHTEDGMTMEAGPSISVSPERTHILLAKLQRHYRHALVTVSAYHIETTIRRYALDGLAAGQIQDLERYLRPRLDALDALVHQSMNGNKNGAR